MPPRAAVDARPKNLDFKSELALALDDQGNFFMEIGLGTLAAERLREALTIRQELHATGQMPRSFVRYLAANHASLGRTLARSGNTADAEVSYKEALKLLTQLVKQFPDSPFFRATLAQTLANFADLLDDLHRQQEVEVIRGQVVVHYEYLAQHFPEDPGNQRNLVLSYLQLGAVHAARGRLAAATVKLCEALGVAVTMP